MVKAGALYLVIVVTLVVAVLCSSLIVAAYLYKSQYQQKFRYDVLSNNLLSAENLVLSVDSIDKKLSLFNSVNDSVIVQRYHWGLFDIGIARSFINQDTLTKVFSIAHSIDSAKWCAIYLIDEDRPVSVSGQTTIKGDAYLPKAGIKEAYVDNSAYLGDKRLVIGRKLTSEKQLPTLNSAILAQIKSYFKQVAANKPTISIPDSASNLFLQNLKTYCFHKKAYQINSAIKGHVLIQSDTTIRISREADIRDAIICAPTVIVEDGFTGNYQIFATDSVHIGKNCKLTYPSVIGALQEQRKDVKSPARIIIGENTRIDGTLFTFQDGKSQSPPVIELKKNTVIQGQVYASGILNYQKDVTINGSVYVSRLLYETTYTRYENYLINIHINTPALSRYYNSSGLLPAASPKQKVLQWLN
ncbi:hypothetical protein MUY27_20110 [Mucilaginibacter sp. RS28]|uniref:Uncharacterized protein n=1 Tax=Mucilaginibacter straminoryzae TaxID=2932774 RepID=A0A9X1X6K9_9SPHI|nr:hypothetical protein [Mucilaginibacter straminoryzae]MCJ8212032.1 hypothetical protein [Mucilaginibacter straminoryzae]